MVIKVIQLSAFEAAKWVAALSVISTFIWSVGGFLALMIWNTYRDEVISAAGLASREDVARLEKAVSGAAQSFDALSRQIVILSRPPNVAIYREPPRAVQGYCRAGEACAISVFAERDPRASDCRIQGDRAELLIITGDREYAASPAPGRVVNNLGPQPRVREPTFLLPEGIPAGTGTAIIRSFYRDCIWQDAAGQPPVMQDSPPFQLEIRP